MIEYLIMCGVTQVYTSITVLLQNVKLPAIGSNEDHRNIRTNKATKLY